MYEPADLPWEELNGNLRAFIGRRVRNPADVDDLVQRVMLQIVTGLESLRDLSRLHAWVYRTARNVIVDYYRAAPPRHEILVGSFEDIEATAGAAQVGAEGEDESRAVAELARCLQPIMRQLSPSYRDAVVRTDLDGIAQSVVAQEAGVSLSGMKSRVQRGRRQLKAALEACCRIDLDRRRSVVGYKRRASGGRGPCGDDCD